MVIANQPYRVDVTLRHIIRADVGPSPLVDPHDIGDGVNDGVADVYREVLAVIIASRVIVLVMVRFVRLPRVLGPCDVRAQIEVSSAVDL